MLTRSQTFFLCSVSHRIYFLFFSTSHCPELRVLARYFRTVICVWSAMLLVFISPDFYFSISYPFVPPWFTWPLELYQKSFHPSCQPLYQPGHSVQLCNFLWASQSLSLLVTAAFKSNSDYYLLPDGAFCPTHRRFCIFRSTSLHVSPPKQIVFLYSFGFDLGQVAFILLA